jgi:arabinosaccharide transport system substrate-binding protein
LTAPRRQLIPSFLRSILSPGVVVLALLSVGAAIALTLHKVEEPEGITFWTFTRNHYLSYLPVVAEWNASHDPAYQPINMRVIHGMALERRVLSAFMSGTPVADMLEFERTMASRAFLGPVEAVGFTDLTDRLREEGLLESINAASFSPWTSRGRIFGLPHDVHPVLLAYRADIIEAAGIDMGTIETWDDFARVLRPLMVDTTGDGRPNRFLINFWANSGHLEPLILQADGRLFDEHERPVIDSDRNAEILARLVGWVAGPERIAVDAREFTAAGNQLRLDGVVLASLMPDWLAGVWQNDLPGLAGKVKLMPLPAWEPGGRRTTVQGGTMLGIPKSTLDFESAWAFAKALYLSPDLATSTFRSNNIITPVRDLWDLPVYAEPTPYFANQPSGLIFISQAPHVPLRPSSPYNPLAVAETTSAFASLVAFAQTQSVFDVPSLIEPAKRFLGVAQQRVENQISRNAFHRAPAP